MDNQARNRRVRSLLSRARRIRERAKEYRTVEEDLKAMQVIINLNNRVAELVSESIEQRTKHIEDSRLFLNTISKEFSVTLPATVQEKKIWTLVADDHKLILDKTVEILTPHFEVIGTAADGIAASEMIQLLKPEIAVLDISMPYKTGIEITDELKTIGSASKVVILTTHDDFSYREAAFRAGALGYVSKSRMGLDLIPAITRACAGETFISPHS